MKKRLWGLGVDSIVPNGHPVRGQIACTSGDGGLLPCMLYEKAASKATSAEPPPPMVNRNRTIELSTVPVRAHCPSGGGRRYNAIWLRVYDPKFVVSNRTCPFYMKLRIKYCNN